MDTERRVVSCEDTYRGLRFDVKYDALVVAAGCKTNTFGTRGIAELERVSHAVYYLKHLHHARAIRQRVLECFERASSPAADEMERARLLTFVVVGGGATSCEFISELSDFVRSDVRKWYPELASLARLRLVEAGPRILSSFDERLVVNYTAGLAARGVEVSTSTAVRGVEVVSAKGAWPERAVPVATFERKDGTIEELSFGMLVWSAGLAPVKLVERLAKTIAPVELVGMAGRMQVDEFLRVPGLKGRVFALGDCAVDPNAPLPATASVAEQQANYLAKCFNETYARPEVVQLLIAQPEDEAATAKDDWFAQDEWLLPEPAPVHPSAAPFKALEIIDRLYTTGKAFRYVERGSMASMGIGGGITDMTKTELLPDGAPKVGYSGRIAWAMWAGAYLTKQVSYSNMFLIPLYWLKTAVFGRDISRF